jgi:hypothetical protein
MQDCIFLHAFFWLKMENESIGEETTLLYF